MLVLDTIMGWPGVAGAVALTALATAFRRTRASAIVLAVPAFLLVFRKVALYIPIPGALSTDDRIVFWSTGSLVYTCLSLCWITGATYVIASDQARTARRRGSQESFVGFAGLAFGASIALQYYPPALLVPVILLPIEGWNHLTMPLVFGAAALKILLVSPLLLPAIAATAVMAVVLPRVVSIRSTFEIQQLIVVLACVGALGQLAHDGTIVRDVRRRVEKIESWGNNEAAETSGYLGTWFGRLGNIGRCEVNSIDTSGKFHGDGCRIRDAMLSLPRWLGSLPTRDSLIAFASGAFGWVVVLWAQRVRLTLGTFLPWRRAS